MASRTSLAAPCRGPSVRAISSVSAASVRLSQSRIVNSVVAAMALRPPIRCYDDRRRRSSSIAVARRPLA